MKASVTPAANLCNFLYTLWLEGKMAGEQPYNVQVKPSIEKMENTHLHTHTLAVRTSVHVTIPIDDWVLWCRVQEFQPFFLNWFVSFLIEFHSFFFFSKWGPKGLLSPPDGLDFFLCSTGWTPLNMSHLRAQPRMFHLQLNASRASADRRGHRPAVTHDRRRLCYLHWAAGELFAERDNLTVR